MVGYYNRRSVLDRTIRSLLAQTLTDFELIVFDDASTDGTAEALRALHAELDDPRFRYIVHEKNQGFVRGLIDAIAGSTGDYIAIHGSGDVAMPRRLELQAELLDARPEVGAVGCWYENVNDITGSRTVVRTDADSFELSDLENANPFSHGEVMIRRTAYDRAGGYRPEFRFAQDIDLWMRIRQFARIATVPELLYERHILSDGVTHNPKKFGDQARFSILARRLTTMSETEVEAALARVRSDGPGAVIPREDPALQKRYIRGTINIGRSGSTANAVASAKENIVNPWIRAGLVAVFTVYGSPLRKPIDALRGVIRSARAAVRRRRG